MAYKIYQEQTVIVIDNAACHSNIERVLLDPEFERSHFLRMSLYSPMIKPIFKTIGRL